MSETAPDYVADYPYDHPFTGKPQKQVITYPYPPFVVMDNGDYYEMPDPVTLVKMVYDLKKRVDELEGGKNECSV